MSVLIKGIELPEKVQVLELHPGGKVFTRKGYLVGEAVELPDHHGRLVDADALIEKYWDGNSMTITALDLKDINVVIEAEGE